MSETQVNPNTNTPNMPAAGTMPPDMNQAAVPTPTDTAPAASVQPQAPSQGQPNPAAGVQFSSTTIGTQTAKPQDLFAEQNRVANEKKQKAKHDRKILFIVLGVVLGVAIIGVILWFVLSSGSSKQAEVPSTPYVRQPILADDSTDSINALRDEAQSIFNETNRIADVNQFFNEEKELIDQAYYNQFILGELLFYVPNGFYRQADIVGNEVDPEALTLEQRGTFYDAMYNTYMSLGDDEKAGEYFGLSYMTQIELQGYDEGDENGEIF